MTNAVGYVGPPAICEFGPESWPEGVLKVLHSGGLALVRGMTDLDAGEVLRLSGVIGPVFTPVSLPPGREVANATELRELGEIEYATNWHHDQSFVVSPPDWSVLYCHEPGENRVPTVLADGAGVIEFLTPAFVDVLRTLRAEHLAYYPSADEERVPVIARAPHEVVLEVEGGVPAVFVAPATVRSFVGWTERESAGLLLHLFATLNWPELSVSHFWRRGDLLMWPNRRYPHRTLPINAGSTRHLTRVVGHWPV